MPKDSHGGRRPKHHRTYPGKIVEITLTNGEMFVDRFLESRDKRMRLERHGWLQVSKIARFIVFTHGRIQAQGQKTFSERFKESL